MTKQNKKKQPTENGMKQNQIKGDTKLSLFL